MINPIRGDKSAVGVLKIECFSKYRIGSNIGAINEIKIFLKRALIGNQEVII
jgi:hypothetical protein